MKGMVASQLQDSKSCDPELDIEIGDGNGMK